MSNFLDSVLTFLSPVVGANVSANHANEKKQDLYNQQQNALNERSLALAEQMNKQGLATQVDANGNITFYDEKTNTWRTVLAKDQAQINDAANIEMLRALSVDAPLARGELLRNSQRRMQEAGSADALKMQMDNTIAGKGNITGADLASTLRKDRTTAINKGFDDVQTAGMTQALRSGTGMQGVGAALAKARSQQIAQTMGSPDIEGRQAAIDENSTKLSNSINNYGTMANRAGASADFAPPNPNITTNLSAAAQRQAALGLNGAGAAAQTINGIKLPQPVPTHDYSSLIASVASAFAGMPSGAALPSRASSSKDYINTKLGG